MDRPRPLPGTSEARLEALRAEAEAFRALLGLRPAEVAERIGERRRAVAATLDQLERAIEARRELPIAAKVEFRVAARVLRTLVERDRRPTRSLDAERRRIADAAAAVEGELSIALLHAPRGEATLVRALRRHRRAIDALAMDLRIAAACARRIADRPGTAIATRRQEIGAELTALSVRLDDRRARLEAQRESFAVRWRKLEEDLSASVDAVSAALERLLA